MWLYAIIYVILFGAEINVILESVKISKFFTREKRQSSVEFKKIKDKVQTHNIAQN